MEEDIKKKTQLYIAYVKTRAAGQLKLCCLHDLIYGYNCAEKTVANYCPYYTNDTYLSCIVCSRISCVA